VRVEEDDADADVDKDSSATLELGRFDEAAVESSVKEKSSSESASGRSIPFWGPGDDKILCIRVRTSESSPSSDPPDPTELSEAYEEVRVANSPALRALLLLLPSVVLAVLV
jgi:hypothetical protein